LIILLLFQGNSYAQTTWIDLDYNKNNKDYIRRQWKEYLGFDFFWVYYKIKDEQKNIKQFIGFQKNNWDFDVKINKDNFNIAFNKDW
jgi:hypothetical protein